MTPEQSDGGDTLRAQLAARLRLLRNFTDFVPTPPSTTAPPVPPPQPPPAAASPPEPSATAPSPAPPPSATPPAPSVPTPVAAAAPSSAEAPATPAASVAAPSPEPLAAIRDDLGDCQRCRLSEQRNSIVFGVGNPDADIMFIGEGPGADEDRLGEPFVGRAGKLLDEMIVKCFLRQRSEVYIANIVKCRPPGNRNPEADEIATCLPFLERQIASVRPRVICVLGTVAIRALFPEVRGISAARGSVFDYSGIPVVPTYHPAYLLRSHGSELLDRKREVLNDAKTALGILAAPPDSGTR